MQDAMRELALQYIANGWAILALHGVTDDGECTCGDPHPGERYKSKGKHPRTDLSPQGVLSATLDPNEVVAWPDDINIGIALGEASGGGLVAFDVDDPDVAEALLHPTMGLTDMTAVSVTGRGAHILMGATGSLQTFHIKTTDGKNIGEIRGNHAYIVAPPSRHYSGKEYRWAGADKGSVPVLSTVSDASAWMMTLLDKIGIPAESIIDSVVQMPGDDTQVVECDVPEELVATRHLTDVVQILKGNLGKFGGDDRSGKLYNMGFRLLQEAILSGQPIDERTIAGILKKADRVYYGKYTDRRNADAYYMLTARNVLSERERLEAKATKRGQKAPSGKPSDEVMYVWDAGMATLYLTRGKREWTKVANFLPEIITDVEIDNGDEVTRAWQVRLSLADGRSTEFFLPAEERSSYTLFSSALAAHCPSEYIIYPGMQEHVRAAMQEFSGATCIKTREFACCGWVEYGTKRLYLLPGADGAIGPDGLDLSIRINPTHLPPDEPITSRALAAYGKGVRPPATKEEYRKAWWAFKALIEAGPAHLTMGVALQVLGGPLFPAGAGERPPLVHVQGLTGSFKTSFSFAALSIFGTFNEQDAPPSNWGSTGNSLQTFLHTAKDLTLLVDDYKNSVVKSRREIVQLIQQYADGSVRMRQTTRQRLQRAQHPRGLMLSNGEDVWEKEASAEARTLMLRMRKGDIDKEKLSIAQNMIRNGDLQLFGGAYLQWLARNPDVFDNNEVSQQRQALRIQLEAKMRAEGKGNMHPRLVSGIASLAAIGLVFMRFVNEVYPSQSKLAAEWVRQSVFTMLGTAKERGDAVEEGAPFRQFSSVLVGSFAKRTGSLWPGDGMTEHTGRFPSVTQSDTVGYWFDRDGERWVMLTSNVTYDWYQRELFRSGGDMSPFSWNAIRNDAMEQWGARVARNVRVKVDDSSSRPMMNGILIPLSQLLDAGGGYAEHPEHADPETPEQETEGLDSTATDAMIAAASDGSIAV